MDFAQHRKALGLSLEQAAIALGLAPTSKGWLSEIENGKRDASLRLALKIERWSAGAVPASSVCAELRAANDAVPSAEAANGENAQERRPDHVRASNDGPPGQNISDAMIQASVRLEVVMENMAPQHGRMLMELLKPDADLITRWRSVVERCTGETHSHAQAATVRAACTSLVWVKDNLGRLEKARRDRRLAA